jgi:protein-tyrosine phosphatase
MGKVNSIIFVCLGNICRSPIAEGVAKKLNEKYDLDIRCESAGTSSYHNGENPCTNSQIVAKNHGVDISDYRSTQVTKKDFEEFDLVIGLDKSNVSNLKDMGCNDPLLLGDFGFDGKDVPDPYFFDGFEGFEKVYSMIESSIEELYRQKVL